MSDVCTIRRCAMAAVLLVASVPVTGTVIVPLDHPTQLLEQMQGEELRLSSASGKGLIDDCFKPRSADDKLCLSPTPTRIGIEMICEYRPPESTEAELFPGVDGTGARGADRQRAHAIPVARAFVEMPAGRMSRLFPDRSVVRERNRFGRGSRCFDPAVALFRPRRVRDCRDLRTTSPARSAMAGAGSGKSDDTHKTHASSVLA